MTLKFTARTIETIRPVPGRRIDVFDASLPGLALRVTASGHKSWTVHYRNAARRLRRLTLGDGSVPSSGGNSIGPSVSSVSAMQSPPGSPAPSSTATAW